MTRRRLAPLPPRHHFVRRLAGTLAVAALLVFASLGMGTVGYRFTEGLSWIDSLYNASMILTGMGPAVELKHDSAKLFATFYALFAGIVFLTTAALILIPVAHRVLHRFHLELESADEPADPKPGPPPR
jgi:predicted transporter